MEEVKAAIRQVADKQDALAKTLEATLDALDHRRRTQDTRFAEIQAQYKALDVLLRGNGVPGLVSRVSLLEQADEAHGQGVQRLETNQGRLVWGLVGALATAAGTLVLVVIGLVSKGAAGP